ncbi:MAG: class I SAM-dependent methyltransferase [Sphingobacteriales bacterium]|nr:class I SAM-dependent methyltransferase [Sphingobacteriales bacterium]
MKYILIIGLIILVSLKLSAMSIFLQATKSGWYPEFLQSVVITITSNNKPQKILDIGTGPGTLPQMLIQKNEALQITGIDIDKSMIAEAKRRLTHQNVSFRHQIANEPLPFADSEFDIVTFCSALFLLDDSAKKSLLDEAKRVLKPNGKIIALTPSGKKSIISSFAGVWKYPFSSRNYTFMVWKTATTNSGRKWQKQKWLFDYATQSKLQYSSSLTFNDNASLEILTKQVNK